MLDLGNYSISSLYAGGWRSTDKAELISEYELTEEEADLICKALKEIERSK